MAHSLSSRRLALFAAGLLVVAPGHAGKVERAGYNRGDASVHEPIVSRTDYAVDLAAGPDGLAPGEAQRLAGWFDGLALGYGDQVMVDQPGGWQGSHGYDAVGSVLSRYGMLISAEPVPANVGRPQAGSIRVVVSRAIARVEGCPDWSRGNMAEFDGATTSNFGCATAQALAAMIANPQDLVRGVQAGPSVDPRTSVKAVTTWRDAPTTGAAGLPGGVTSMSVVKGGK